MNVGFQPLPQDWNPHSLAVRLEDRQVRSMREGGHSSTSAPATTSAPEVLRADGEDAVGKNHPRPTRNTADMQSAAQGRGPEEARRGLQSEPQIPKEQRQKHRWCG